ncbi:MAG: hypothetical protein A3K16_03690 [Omnitrophica bacterium RIFCSPLOWO2_01_FULL_45_24]|nr:MAG: hypothetical protein A3K16_03690 [Omnitrophica bacterium RIFCSPLOWO2_01_FULL_45_24]
MKVQEILKITKGKLLSGDSTAEIDLATILTDSRNIKTGEFFLPLKGNNFDGEEFIGEAFKKGAVGAFTIRQGARAQACLPRTISAQGLPARLSASASASQGRDGKPRAGVGQEKIIIQVKNTTKALQEIAHEHRIRFDIPVIGVTGSNGKTTVKDMTAKVLSSKYKVLKNEGTKNNHIGLPQTLLKLKKYHEICILEMGTNHKGEIRSLADIARPNIAVITNIGPSHLEFLKDLKGIFESKKEIFEFLDEDSLVILNGDDKYLSKIKNNKFKIMRFGFNKVNDFRASIVSTEKDKIVFLLNNKSPFVLNLAGIHNIYNALAAIAVARHFELDYDSIKKGLAECVPAYMRLNIKNIDGVVVIDDAYNSNPLSMRAALETIKSYPAKSRWIVSADMLELGEKENYFHRGVGEAVVRGGFDGLVTFGKLSQQTSSAALKSGMAKNRIWHCSNHEEIAAVLRKVAKAGDVVLIKGSRTMKMEKVLEILKDK